MKVIPLKNNVAVEIKDIDITNADEVVGAKISSVLKNNPVVVIKKQDKSSGNFTNFVSKVGKIKNHCHFVFDPITGEKMYSPSENDAFIDPSTWPDKNTYPVQRVTGKKVNGKASGVFGTGILDWHANLNGHDRADGVALQGYEGCEGTSTTWLNTARVFEEMPEDLKERCKNVYCEYIYSPDIWGAGQSKEQQSRMLKNPSIYKMWLIQKNIAGKHGIYFYTTNRCKIITKDKKLYDDLYDFTFQKKYMYTHEYEIGDIILSDQLLSLHKRDQNDPDILSKRILHRITFGISNVDKPSWISLQNNIP